MTINDVLTIINNWMYTYVLIIMLLGTGIYFTVRTRCVQFRLLKDGIKSMLTKNSDAKSDNPPEKKSKKMSSFQALMISTASRVGTGNIAGIATAIATGGPGAVFWMWVTAIIGSASAFVESTLAQVYKVRTNGEFRGGPSYYMEKALGKRWMGVLFSVLLIICFAYGFNGLQAYNISSTLTYYIPDYSETAVPMILGLVLAALTAAVIWGGAHRIGFISSVLVPIMAIAYILLGIITMIINVREIPGIFAMIISDALDVQSIMGGFAGSAVCIGIKRGLFSNEAGMGSAPNASASADVAHPVNQGLVQVISVFIDTLLVCSSTAMILFTSGVTGESGVLDGMPYVQAAICANVGEWGIHFITIAIFAFAFSSIIGNYFYAESNILFIKNNRIILFLFRVTCVIAVFLGAQADFSLVWNIADVTMGFMAIVNIIAILLLGGVAVRVLIDYENKKKQGLPVVFYEDELGISGTIWKRNHLLTKSDNKDRI